MFNRFKTNSGLATAVLLFSAIAFLAGSFIAPVRAQDDEPQKPPFMLNLTSGQEDLHAVWMGLRLANYALEEDRDVVVFLNVRGVEFARADLSDAVQYRDDPPIRQMLRSLADGGATVYVCPHCMKSCGIDESALARGFRVASDRLFDHLTAEAVVFSY